ncbi:MAG TPA: hypothetical protein VFR86_16380 [Burkholderiaceae bacterium]|nr:hypothetical protein [Burkholderiaceae bacterium]
MTDVLPKPDSAADADPELETLRTNAWCGEPAMGSPGDQSLGWGARRDMPPIPQRLARAPVPVDLSQWADPRVGWGAVLPMRQGLTNAELAEGVDAPEPIRELIKARGNAPVFRYRGLKGGLLTRFYTDGKQPADLNLRGLRGIGPTAVPRYLLLIGTPEELPWGLQMRLQAEAFVGRLDLDPAGLERYVEALLGEWHGATRDVKRPVIWAVDHGHPDITRLMRRTIAERVLAKFKEDNEFDVAKGFFSDVQATHHDLVQALGERQPAFVVTSSHGATFPLDQPAAMRAQLGLLVDHQKTLTDANAVVGAWNARGAIWYAHACCSAGTEAKSRFEGLVGADSSLGKTLAAISQVGACTAPLPRALLGGKNPLGAFIGHIEPTFDWTLRDPTNGQVTTQHIVDALYEALHAADRPPIGKALAGYFRAVAGLLQDYADALDAVDAQESGALQRARRARLIAADCQAMVILGDPTVRLPLPEQN